jgi:hypothetical protein
MADLVPRCPHCNARGSEFVATESKEMFTLVYCAKCGAIHGVVPGVTPSNRVNGAKPARLLERMNQAQAVSVKIEAEEAPLCPQHHLVMEKKTIPPGQKDAGKPIWLCPRSKECHQWRKIETPTSQPDEPLARLSAMTTDQTRSDNKVR